MPIPESPVPEFCAACGFPLRGTRCEACGVERVASGRRVVAVPEADRSDFEAEGWRARDPLRFVGHCITSEAGTGVPSTSSQDGIGWIFTLRGAALFVSFDPGTERVSIDAPVARVPERQRVPVLRAALELNEETSPARFCLRDDLLVLRRIARVQALSVSALRKALRASAETADRLGALFASWFEARPPFTDEQRASLGWASVGRSRPLKSFSIPPPPARSLPPPPPASQRPPMPPPPPLPPLPPPPRMGGVEAGWGAPKQPESAPRAVIRDTDGIPDILSPMLVSPSSASPSTPAPAPAPAPEPSARAMPYVPRKATPPPAPSSRPPDARASASLLGGLPGEARSSEMPTRGPALRPALIEATAPPVSVPFSVRPPASSEAEAEARRPAGAGLPSEPPSADRERTPAERFCQLLRDAQSHATAVSFQDRPGVMLIVIRSTVFRAILEHGEALPQAVANLYRATAAVTRDLAQAEAAGRRVSPAVMAEPALHAMEQLVSARGQAPDEKPLQIEPLTSAAHAREHLSRYLREIERAPVEPALRHFLALGALSELLVRARLPAKTDQRLREIVAYAHRDGPKGAAIELMMTALNRIVAP